MRARLIEFTNSGSKFTARIALPRGYGTKQVTFVVSSGNRTAYRIIDQKKEPLTRAQLVEVGEALRHVTEASAASYEGHYISISAALLGVKTQVTNEYWYSERFKHLDNPGVVASFFDDCFISSALDEKDTRLLPATLIKTETGVIGYRVRKADIVQYEHSFMAIPLNSIVKLLLAANLAESPSRKFDLVVVPNWLCTVLYSLQEDGLPGTFQPKIAEFRVVSGVNSELIYLTTAA
jgi:hypothetical protein